MIATILSYVMENMVIVRPALRAQADGTVIIKQQKLSGQLFDAPATAELRPQTRWQAVLSSTGSLQSMQALGLRFSKLEKLVVK